MTHVDLGASLSAVPKQLRLPLLAQFEEALEAYRASDWEKVGLKAGKLCEIAYTICEGHATGTYAAAPRKPRNMIRACQKLENYNHTKGRSLCIQVPRVLIGLYELRNNRAIGHVSAEVDPNHMDAEFFLRGMKWIIGEFVRFFSKLPLEDSRATVNAVTVRTHGIVWKQGNVRRVLDPSKSTWEKVLILAYAEDQAVSVSDLIAWTGYSNPARLRRAILKKLDQEALIHYSENADTVQILPPGQRCVEENALLSYG